MEQSLKTIDYVQLELFPPTENLESLETNRQGSRESELEEEWFALTIDAPFGDLLLKEKKLWETRRTGTSSPKRVFIHTSLKKLKGFRSNLARKYLGESYQPEYGHIIGTGILYCVVTMTEEFIKEQTPDEIELGIWKVARKAWRFQCFERIEPIPAIGCQGTPWSIDKSKLNPRLREQIQKIWRPQKNENCNLIA